LTLIDGFVALALLAGLLGNRQPLIPITAIFLVVMRGTTGRITHGAGFKRLEWAVVVCLSYWLLNYFWSTGDLSNLLSYDFMRHDGAFLVSYSTLVFLLGWALSPRKCAVFWITLLCALGLIAIPGMIISLNLPLASYLYSPVQMLGLMTPDQNAGELMYLGWYEGHNTVGGVYALASLLALTVVEQDVFGRRHRLFAWALFAACLVGLAFSYSRGNYIAFGLGAFFVLPVRKFSHALKIGLTTVLPAVLIVLTTSSALSHIDTITDPYYGTNADRIRIWKEALGDFEDSPLIGIGFGRFNDTDLQYWGVKNIVWVATHGKIVNDDSHAHNSFLHFLAEGGVAGFAITMFVWWSAWVELSSFQRKFPRWKQAWLLKAGKACLIAALAESMTEHLLGRGVVVLELSALIGMTLASARAVEKAARAAVEKRSRALATKEASLARPAAVQGATGRTSLGVART